jgi:CheY-like chemotaxis protein
MGDGTLGPARMCASSCVTAAAASPRKISTACSANPSPRSPTATASASPPANASSTRWAADIRVTSTPNVGTEFSVTLPAAEGSGTTQPLIPADAAPVPLKHGKGTVLIVDDEDDLRKVAHMILTRCGYEVVQCDNGQDAVKIYQSLFRTGTPPDVVLMDLTLRGGMNGTETAAEILHLDPEARIVCTSGSVTQEVQMIFLERGFVGVLPKPYEAGELTQTVHRVATMMKRN